LAFAIATRAIASKKTRIDAVVARLNAFAREETAARPFARRIVASAAAQQIDDAANDLGRILPLFSGEPSRLSRRADFDAFAAARASVDHGVDTALQCRFEGLSHGHNRNAVRRPIEGGAFTRSARAFLSENRSAIWSLTTFNTFDQKEAKALATR
jgi:hypothetical protein